MSTDYNYDDEVGRTPPHIPQKLANMHLFLGAILPVLRPYDLGADPDPPYVLFVRPE